MNKIVFACLAAALGTLHADVCVKDGDAIAFLGDSITAGGNSSPAGYVNLVMKGLEHCGVQAKKIPAGIGGHKSVQMHERLQRDVLSKKPRWMTFSCGVNDVWHGKNGVPLEKYKLLVGDIFDRCAAAGVEVVVLTATMIGEDPEASNNRKLAPYNEFLRAEAARRGLRIADLNAAMQEELRQIRSQDKTPGNKLTTDGVHMAFPGNCMMAWGVLKALGVEESRRDEFYALFRKVPRAYMVPLWLTADEKALFDAKVKASGAGEESYLKKAVGISACPCASCPNVKTK